MLKFLKTTAFSGPLCLKLDTEPDICSGQFGQVASFADLATVSRFDTD